MKHETPTEELRQLIGKLTMLIPLTSNNKKRDPLIRATRNRIHEILDELVEEDDTREISSNG